MDAGAVRQSETAQRIRELAGRLGDASPSSCAAGGDPAVSSALVRCVGSWQGSLSRLADSVGSLATNLGAASSAYVGTDEGAMPAPR